MSNAADKQIRFQFSVDQRSLETAKSAIRQLTSEVKTLVETMGRANSGIQGLGGGILGGFSGKAGGVNPQQQATMKGGSILTQGIAADAKALAGVAKAGTDAIRQMTSGVKSSLTDQISNLERLKKTVQELEQAYARLKVRGIMSGDPVSAQMSMAGVGAQLQAARSEYSAAQANAAFVSARQQPTGGFVGAGQRVVNRGGIDMVEDEGPEKGIWSRIKGFMGQNVPGAGMLGKAMPFMRQLGIPGWAGATAAVIGAYEAGTNKYLRNDLFQAQEASSALGDSLRRRAAISQAYGGLAMGARRDINQGLAVGGLSPTEIRSALGPEAFNALMKKATQETGNTPRLGDLKDMLMSGNVSYSIKGGLDSQEARAKLERALGDINAEQAQALASAAQQKLQSMSVRETTYMGEFQSNYLSRMQLMRTAGLGGEHNTPLFSGNKAQLLGFGTAYTAEEVAGARASLRSGAGGRYQGMATSLLGWQYGGLGNAVNMIGAAGGYGDPGAFMRAVSRSTSMGGAAGLVDIAAAGGIGDLYTGAMTGGDFNTSGVAGMQGMMSTAALFGGGLRAGRGAGLGYQAMSSYAGGQTDRLQQAINVLASVRQGGTLYSQEALRNMSPAQRMDLMRQINAGTMTDATLPAELKAQGVTVAMLGGYGRERDKYLFAEYMTGQGTAGTNAAVAAWRSQGVASLRGLKGDDLRQAITTLGVAAFQARRAPTVEAGKNLVAQIAAEDPEIFRALKAGGVGDVASMSMEAELKRNRDQNVLDQESFLAKKETKEKIRTGSSYETMQLASRLDTLSTTIGVEGKKVGDELRGLAADIYEARLAIRQNRVARPRAAAPQGK